MRIFGLVCSPREGGNTEIMVKEALKAAEEMNAETELITISKLNISPCIACDSCIEKGMCVIKDDIHQIFERMEKADGIIIGTPVYFVNVSAQAKAIIDRTYSYLFNKKLKGKVAAGIVATRRVGGWQVLSLLTSFFLIHDMKVAGGSIGYGLAKGDVLQGPAASFSLNAIEDSRRIGKKVVKMCSNS